MKSIAYAYKSGEIAFGAKVPKGALPILAGEERVVWEVVSGLARHARVGDAMFVPGIPEAEDEFKALEVLVAFGKHAREIYALRTGDPEKKPVPSCWAKDL